MNIVYCSRAIRWFGDLCFGLNPQETIPYSPDAIESIARTGGHAYRIPAGKRTLTDGEKDVVVESFLDTFVFVQANCLKPVYTGKTHREQLQQVGEFSILTPYEVAVMCEYRNGPFFSGRIRTPLKCGRARNGAKLLTLRANSSSLLCEGVPETSRAPDIGVLAGLRIPVPVSGRLPVAA